MPTGRTAPGNILPDSIEPNLPVSINASNVDGVDIQGVHILRIVFGPVLSQAADQPRQQGDSIQHHEIGVQCVPMWAVVSASSPLLYIVSATALCFK